MKEEPRVAMESSGEEYRGSLGPATAQVASVSARDRRARLYELDRVLDALEQLNLKEARELPASLRGRLAALGVRIPTNASFTALIEGVWELQEQLLLG
jgi:hypothetical protein